MIKGNYITHKHEVAFFKTDHNCWTRVKLNDVLYIKVHAEHYCKVIFKNNESIIIRTTFYLLENLLPNYFERIYRSTIINMYSIDSIDISEEMIELSNGEMLKIGKSFKGKIKDKILVVECKKFTM